MKRLSAMLCITIAVFTFLTFIGSFFVVNPYLSMYLSPGGSINSDFLELNDLDNHGWYASTYMTYNESGVASKTILRRGMNIYDRIQIQAGQKTTLHTFGAGNIEREIAPNKTIHMRVRANNNLLFIDTELYAICTYELDQNARWSKLVITSQGGLETSDKQRNNNLTFQYHPDGTLTKQTRRTTSGTLYHRNYFYTDQLLVKTEDRDPLGTLLGYAMFDYGKHTETRTDFDPFGQKLGYTTTEMDIFGRPAVIKTFDKDGNLTAKQTYSYLIFQYLLSPYGLCYGIIILAFSIFIGLEFTQNIAKTKKKANHPDA